MRKIFTVTIVFALAIAFSSCATRKVSRVNTNEVIDLSGRWNDTDSQLVSAEMIDDLLGARWLPVYESQHNNKRPVVVVGTVTNKSHEHINSETFIVKRDGKKETLTYHPATEERYMLGFSYNPDESQAQIQSVTIGGALADAGIQAGDYIAAVDGNEIASGEALSRYFEDHPLTDQKITLTYLRDGLDYDVEVTPQAVNYVEQGFSYNLGREKTSAPGVIKYSALEVRYWINSTLEGLKLLISGKLGMDSLSGPVGVVNVIGDAYKESKSEGTLMTWLTMINMMILISANLGVANLLPLPALDGGRLVFLLIEAVRGKPVNREAEGMVHFAGLLLLMGLLVFVTFKDIRGLF